LSLTDAPSSVNTVCQLGRTDNSQPTLLIKTTLGTKTANLLLDNGSSVSLIRRRFANNLTYDPLFNPKVVGATGNNIAILGKSVETLAVDTLNEGILKFTYEFWICEEIDLDGILGINFLRDCGAVINFAKSLLIIGEYFIPMIEAPEYVLASLLSSQVVPNYLSEIENESGSSYSRDKSDHYYKFENGEPDQPRSKTHESKYSARYASVNQEEYASKESDFTTVKCENKFSAQTAGENRESAIEKSDENTKREVIKESANNASDYCVDSYSTSKLSAKNASDYSKNASDYGVDSCYTSKLSAKNASVSSKCLDNEKSVYSIEIIDSYRSSAGQSQAIKEL